MAVKQSVIIASVMLLVLFINKGLAIKCYECNSHYNQGCDLVNVPNNYTVDCSTKVERDENNRLIDYTFCRKIFQVIDFSVNKMPQDTRTIRGCGYNTRSYQSTCYNRHGFGGRQIVCACNNEDNCNSSNSLKSTTILLTFFAGFIMYLSQ